MYIASIGEIFLKGKNRINFERKLMRNIRSILNINPNDLLKFRNRYIIKSEIEPKNIKKVFGLIFYTKVIESKLENINNSALSLILNEKTFRITTKKSVNIKKSSQTINEELGAYIISKIPNIKVDLDNSDIDIRLEEINNRFYLYKASDIVRCLGGLPVGTGGFVHLRVKNEVNSTVTGFLLMKRGCMISLSKDLSLLHKFESGFNIRIREEKTTDILATDETYENFEFNQSDKFILKPLIGYTKKEIEEIYNLVKEII
ncbi:hypothetical protein J4230_03260 [Candidatus Woesearchaeota archaeon]|nr:hypothetical protein [Candidatus Woesearchaeota archaeon]